MKCLILLLLTLNFTHLTPMRFDPRNSAGVLGGRMRKVLSSSSSSVESYVERVHSFRGLFWWQSWLRYYPISILCAACEFLIVCISAIFPGIITTIFMFFFRFFHLYCTAREIYLYMQIHVLWCTALHLLQFSDSFRALLARFRKGTVDSSALEFNCDRVSIDL